jgi:uncharacterized protein YbbC (DUF1343 family)
MTGLERLIAEPRILGGGRAIGLLTNPTGVTRDLTPSPFALAQAGIALDRLLGPEHGIDGSGQAGEAPERAADALTGLPVLTTYHRSTEEIVPMLAGLDVLLFDLQDAGSRFYTYLSTLHQAIDACRIAGVRLVVLDRPNPIGWRVEGPVLRPEHRSFVGTWEFPLRHGLTFGEAARAMSDGWEGLEVVPCDPLEPFGPGGLPWVPPSPNIPDVETARLYVGTCLVEGSAMSEGRGTALPFRLVGHPKLDGRAFTSRLNEVALPGVRFRTAYFTPTISKNAGELCAGTQVHVTGHLGTVLPVGLTVLAAAREQGIELNITWLLKLLGLTIEETDFTVGNIRDLAANWQIEAEGRAEELAPYRLYPRA